MDLRHLAEQYRRTEYTPIGRNVVYIHTDYGDMPLKRWQRMARLAIEEEGKSDLLERFEAYLDTHFDEVPADTRKTYALNEVLRGTYIEWENFDVKEADKGDAAEPVRLDRKPDEE